MELSISEREIYLGEHIDEILRDPDIEILRALRESS